MWFHFFIAIIVGVIFTYLPGVLTARALGAPRVTSAQIAPILSLPAYCIVAAIVSALGIQCNWAIVFFPVALVSVAAAVISAVKVRSHKSNGAEKERADSEDSPKPPLPRGLIAVSYVVIGILATCFIFLIPMGDPSLAPQSFDNCYHLNLPIAFVESGNWSMFPADIYRDIRATTTPPVAASFYPAELHTMCAMLISALGVPTQVAQSAMITIATAAIFPLSIHALLEASFPSKPWVPVFGIVTALVVVAIPWQLIIQWPLPPNAFSFALVPTVAACFIALFAKHTKGERAAICLVFLAGLAALAFAQPNGVFTLAGLLAPFLVFQASQGFGSEKLRARFAIKPRLRIASAFICAFAIAGIWTLCFILPPLHNVVWYMHEPLLGKAEALVRGLTLNYMSGTTHWIPAVFAIVGMLYTVKERRYLWITCAYFISLAVFVASSALAVDSFFRYFLSGFWYTDAYRTAGYAAITAIPLITLGLAALHEALAGLLKKARPSAATGSGGMASKAIAAALIAVFGVTTYPIIFDNTRDACNHWYHNPNLYPTDEQQFVEKAMQAIEPGALVLNDPFDGSSLAYSLNGLNVYNRELISYTEGAETKQSLLLRTSLKDIAERQDVRDTLKELGISYVIVLDNEKDGSVIETRYIPEHKNMWIGIDQADASEPYLSEVFREGDMLLLKVN